MASNRSYGITSIPRDVSCSENLVDAIYKFCITSPPYARRLSASSNEKLLRHKRYMLVGSETLSPRRLLNLNPTKIFQ